MRKLSPKSTALIALALAISLTACEFDIKKPDSWSPTFGIPLINTTFGIDALIEQLDEDNLLQSEANGQLLLVYRDSLSWQPEVDLGLPDSLLLPITEKDQTLVYQAPGDKRFDRLTLAGSALGYSISNPFPEAIDFSLVFENLSLDSQPFAFDLVLPAAQGGVPSTTMGELPLNAYQLDLTGDLRIQYTAVRSSDGTTVDLPPFAIALRAIDFSYIEGYFGGLLLDIPLDTLPFEYLDSWDSGQIEFVEPELTFTFTHDIGLPLELFTNTLDVKTFQRGIVPLSHPVLNGGLLLSYPDTDEVGEPKTTLWRFHRGNSNITEAVSGIPDELYYDLSLLANLAGNDNISNHLTDSARLHIGLEAEIPLYASASDFELVDTFALSFNTEEFDDARQLDFKLVVGNGFPVEVGMQLYFLDEDKMVFDSLFDNGATMLEAAELAPDGFAASKIERIEEVRFDDTRVNTLLQQTAYLRVQSLVESPQQGATAARLSENDEIEIRLGVLATF
ncbi:MAG: hypothetical protein GVY26_17950 [Bacteroidetes bacterium]|jgi:hypothetical protein|nr:hypothetical protein [Bacteroidota bacterium]